MLFFIRAGFDARDMRANFCSGVDFFAYLVFSAPHEIIVINLFLRLVVGYGNEKLARPLIGYYKIAS